MWVECTVSKEARTQFVFVFLFFFCFLFYLFIFFYGYSTNNIQIETYEHYKIYNNYLNYKLQRKEEMIIKKLE